MGGLSQGAVGATRVRVAGRGLPSRDVRAWTSTLGLTFDGLDPSSQVIEFGDARLEELSDAFVGGRHTENLGKTARLRTGRRGA